MIKALNQLFTKPLEQAAQFNHSTDIIKAKFRMPESNAQRHTEKGQKSQHA